MKGNSVLFLTILLAILNIQSSAYSDEKSINSSLMDLFSAELEIGNCSKAWNMLWNVGRNGDSKALATLALAGVYRGLVAPSEILLTEKPLENYRIKNYLALTLFGWRSLEQELSEFGLGSPSQLDSSISAGQLIKVNKCLTSTKAKQTCVYLAVEVGLIPSFKEYVSTIDSAKEPAHCIKLD